MGYCTDSLVRKNERHGDRGTGRDISKVERSAARGLQDDGAAARILIAQYQLRIGSRAGQRRAFTVPLWQGLAPLVKLQPTVAGSDKWLVDSRYGRPASRRKVDGKEK